MANPRKDVNRIGRAHIVYYVFFLLALVVIVKILLIQYRDGEELRAKAQEMFVYESVIPAERGNIYSKDMELISTSLPKFDIFVDFSKSNITDTDFNSNIDSLIICLSNHFDVKTTQEFRDLLMGYRRDNHTYGLVLRNIDYNELKLVRTFPLFNLGRYRGGIIEVKKDKRFKPFGILADRTIGFSREDYKVGLEGAYDVQLAGKDGKRLKQRLPNNKYVPLDDKFLVEPTEGIDIVTTIDMYVQDVTETALHEHLIKHDAQWGCAVLMEVETGEIRAIANLQKDKNGNYAERYNHAVGTRYEPGSTFKLFSMMAMLEDKNIDLNEIVPTGDGRLKLDTGWVTDEYPLGDITAAQVFEKSSNVGTVMLMKKRYASQPTKFIDRLISMKLNEIMGIDIHGEQPAQFAYPGTRDWYKTSLPTISYGYGISITPLQLLAYYNAVVNGGKLMRPMFVRSFSSSGKTIKSFQPVVLHERICSKETCDILMQLMEGVVETGTARRLKDSPCKIAGKTGTARIYDDKIKSYTREYNASFVGYFPAESPKYSCIVLINKPSSGFFHGGQVAAPVFREIAEVVYATELDIHDPVSARPVVGLAAVPRTKVVNSEALKMYFKLMPQELKSVNIPQSQWVNRVNDTIPVFHAFSIEADMMPDVVGMTLRDAVYLLEQLGCKVKAFGSGKVVRQSVAHGKQITDGQIITLTLK